MEVSLVSKTADELDEMRAEIAAGTLPPDAIKQYYAEEARNVYGHDFKRDRSGKPIEQGVGSPSNMTRNSIESYKRFCSHEPEFEKHVSRMEKQLAEADARRVSERGDAP
jgi:hypothetical protein